MRIFRVVVCGKNKFSVSCTVCHSDPYFYKHHVLLLARIDELGFRMHKMDSIIWWYGEHKRFVVG